jgi:transposase-like protein
MTNLRRKHTARFKTRVVLELLKEEKTSAQIASQFGVHSTQIRHWKRQALEGMENVFSKNGVKSELVRKNELIEQLYKQIGQLKVESDFLKKKMGLIT